MTNAKPIRPIQNQRDYDAALERTNKVFQAEPGASLGNERDVLADLIEL